MWFFIQFIVVPMNTTSIFLIACTSVVLISTFIPRFKRSECQVFQTNKQMHQFSEWNAEFQSIWPVKNCSAESISDDNTNILSLVLLAVFCKIFNHRFFQWSRHLFILNAVTWVIWKSLAALVYWCRRWILQRQLHADSSIQVCRIIEYALLLVSVMTLTTIFVVQSLDQKRTEIPKSRTSYSVIGWCMIVLGFSACFFLCIFHGTGLVAGAFQGIISTTNGAQHDATDSQVLIFAIAVCGSGLLNASVSNFTIREKMVFQSSTLVLVIYAILDAISKIIQYAVSLRVTQTIPYLGTTEESILYSFGLAVYLNCLVCGIVSLGLLAKAVSKDYSYLETVTHMIEQDQMQQEIAKMDIESHYSQTIPVGSSSEEPPESNADIQDANDASHL